MLNFEIEYADCKIDVKATSPFKAFEKALRLHPDKQPLRAVCQGRLAGQGSFPYVSLTYDAPPKLKLASPPEAELANVAEQPWLPGLEK
ncbi:MAG TPA: hypothetical protein VFU09_08795 [Candidatus Udaeobacter sp.]|jgi:hypothetical protein|nr:hypothetical protein [Candidatus Udaeobacter sp.]